VPTYRDHAIVLHTHLLGEADRIVTFLTKEHGKVRAVARGIRKSTSRFGARLDPLNLVEIQFAEGKNLDIVSQVLIVGAYGSELSGRYEAWTVGCAMAEMTDKLVVEEGEKSVQQFLLLLAGLKSLTEDSIDIDIILNTFMVRSIAIAGWSSSYSECAQCHEPGPHSWYSLTHGGVLCTNCKVPGSSAPGGEVIDYLAHLLTGNWEVAKRADEKTRKTAGSLIAAQLQWHLEREVRSLKHVQGARKVK
jgi:DNA repair protein RecO (recombination protein O)